MVAPPGVLECVGPAAELLVRGLLPEGTAILMGQSGGREMERAEAMALQTRLLEVFRIHKLDVAVGITSNGVMIGSQDERVDAKNLGEVTVQKRSVPPTREELLGDG